ncbi:MAG: DUF2095 family protein [Desulfurococcaceae archaeon]
MKTLSQEFDLEEFKKRFPKLAEEIFGDKANKPNQIKLTVDVETLDPWRGYVPTSVDYIRRCNTVEEANEVIDYLLRRGELSEPEAEKLREILRRGGIDAFGGKKEDNYYYKQAKRYWSMIRKLIDQEAET